MNMQHLTRNGPPATLPRVLTDSAHPRPTAGTLPVATALFFCSGALGLGYELIWIRKAALVVGASQIAMSTVLTSFFFGLALGSYCFGRYLKSKKRSPLLLYGLLEILIGLYAFAFPLLFRLLKATYGAAYPLLDETAAGLFALRFLLLFLLFLVPTFFMGGTLPLLLDALVSSDRTIGSRTSFLYGVNILGAVAGVLLTGYYAIPFLGMNGTSRIAGLGNLAIGAIAILAFRRLSPVLHEEREPPLGRFFTAAAFASGLLGIAYQICWARYFSLFNTNTVYLTAMLLAVFLLSLAVGSFLLAPLLQRRWRPLRILAWCQALVPLAVASTIDAWRLAEYRMVMATEAGRSGRPRPLPTFELDHGAPQFWHFIGETADAVFFAPLFQTALVIFVPVVLIGTAVPALIAAATPHSSEVRGVSGRLVFWNTIGSSAGGFLAGYVLLPGLGLHGTLVGVGLGSLGLSIASTAKSHAAAPGSSRRWAYAVPGIGLLALVAFLTLREDVTRETIRREQFRGVGSASAETAARDTSGLEIKALIEGPLTTAYVAEDERSVRLGSGFVQMGYVFKNDVSGQTIAGHLPSLFFPGRGAPKNCLGICLGSGQSFGALLRYPIERLDVVDISQEIMTLTLEHFAPYNNDLGRDPRVRLHLDDGRHFVERAPDGFYDVVSMEPPPPTSDGIHSLYSVEFYREVERILRAEGVAMQWLPLNILTPLDARSVIKTMAEVFPQTFVAKVTMGDFVVLGYPSRPTFVVEAIRERSRTFAAEWSERGASSDRWSPESAYPVASFEGLVPLLVMGPETVRRMTSPLIFRDDRQLLGYSSGDRWLARRYGGVPLIHITFGGLPVTDLGELGDYFDPPLSPALLHRLRVEQVAGMRNLNFRDPVRLARSAEILKATTEPADRVERAVALALDFDAMLKKERAFEFVGIALDTLARRPESIRQRHLDAVRKIVRNRLAVYAQLTARQIDTWAESHAGAPLLDAMRRELEDYRTREAAHRAFYLFR